MNRAWPNCGVVALVGAVIIALACMVSVAYAQDPVIGALATLAAATSQAQARQWQAAQAATRQAIDAQATQQAQVALATRQAIDAQLTRQAIDAQATRTAIDAQATSQAVSAQATAQTYQVQAQATRQAVDLEATRAAYQQAEVDRGRSERTAQATEAFLYLALGLGLADLGVVLWRVVLTLRAIERRAAGPASSQAAAQGDAQVIDGEFTERNARGLDLNVTEITV